MVHILQFGTLKAIGICCEKSLAGGSTIFLDFMDPSMDRFGISPMMTPPRHLETAPGWG